MSWGMHGQRARDWRWHLVPVFEHGPSFDICGGFDGCVDIGLLNLEDLQVFGFRICLTFLSWWLVDLSMIFYEGQIIGVISTSLMLTPIL